jgi:hypothetical protein
MPDCHSGCVALAGPGLTDPLKAEAMRLDGRLRVPLADPPSAPQRLYTAAKMPLPLDVQLARGAFLEALETCFVAQHFTIGVSPEEIARAALATSNESVPDGAADLVLGGTANLFVANFPEAMEALRRAMPVLREGSISRDELVRWFNLVLALANELSDDTTVTTRGSTWWNNKPGSTALDRAPVRDAWPRHRDSGRSVQCGRARMTKPSTSLASSVGSRVLRAPQGGSVRLAARSKKPEPRRARCEIWRRESAQPRPSTSPTSR